MIKVVKDTKSIEKGSTVIGTHDGIFHNSDVVATAIIDLALNGREISVLRSNDIDYLHQNSTIIVDTGGGNFDFSDEARINGVKYASSGLAWRAFGKNIIRIVSNCPLDDCDVNNLFIKIDEEFIQPIDMEYYGCDINDQMLQCVDSFLPNDDSNYDGCFQECSNIVSSLFKGIILGEIAKEVIANKTLKKKKTFK